MNIGDILLCSGNGFYSQRIKKYNRIVLRAESPAANLSHVAMVGPTETDVFEATTLNKWCGKRGVQYNPFVDWVRNYDGMVWIRRAYPGAVTKDMRIRMQSKMLAMIGIPYEHGIPGVIELALAGIGLPYVSKEIIRRMQTRDAVHCSESVGDVLQRVDVLPRRIRTNKIPPAVWWSGIKELDIWYEKPERIK